VLLTVGLSALNLTARKADPAIIYFYQHIVPKGTKIEQNYF
jgi:hypothetical protein